MRAKEREKRKRRERREFRESLCKNSEKKLNSDPYQTFPLLMRPFDVGPKNLLADDSATASSSYRRSDLKTHKYIQQAYTAKKNVLLKQPQNTQN